MRCRGKLEIMRVILIHNPKAGGGKPSAFRLKTLFEEAGHEVLYASTMGAEWEKLLGKSADVAIIAGGDGSVSLAALRLAERGLPFCLLPLGTANNIAKSLNEDRRIDEIVAAVNTAKERSLDLGMVASCRGSQPPTESVGVGVLVELLREDLRKTGAMKLSPMAEREIALGRLRKISEEYKGIECELHLDGEKLNGRYLWVEVMNMGLIGPNLPLAPDADPGDGRLDVVFVEMKQRRGLRNYFERLSTNEHAVLPALTRRCRRVEIHCSKANVHVDDATYDFAVAAVEVKHGALRFLEPTDS